MSFESAGFSALVHEDTMPSGFGDSVNLHAAKSVNPIELARVAFRSVGRRFALIPSSPCSFEIHDRQAAILARDLVEIRQRLQAPRFVVPT